MSDWWAETLPSDPREWDHMFCPKCGRLLASCPGIYPVDEIVARCPGNPPFVVCDECKTGFFLPSVVILRVEKTYLPKGRVGKGFRPQLTLKKESL